MRFSGDHTLVGVFHGTTGLAASIVGGAVDAERAAATRRSHCGCDWCRALHRVFIIRGGGISHVSRLTARKLPCELDEISPCLPVLRSRRVCVVCTHPRVCSDSPTHLPSLLRAHPRCTRTHGDRLWVASFPLLLLYCLVPCFHCLFMPCVLDDQATRIPRQCQPYILTPTHNVLHHTSL